MTSRPRHLPEDEQDPGPSGPTLSIPDGGLGSVMPEWMRQTPSWKRMPEQLAVRPLPQPDSSIIDPRELIDVDDLPEWLQAVAARATGSRPDESSSRNPVQPSFAEPGKEVTRPGPPTVPVGDREPPEPPATARTDVSRPIERSGNVDHQHVRLTPSPSPVERPWWMSDVVVAALFVAIVLTLIYVVLVASGVV